MKLPTRILHRSTTFALCLTANSLLLAACTIADEDQGPNAIPAGSASAAEDPIVCPAASSTDPLVVATNRGLVRGKETGSGYAFLGIPFAKPPVGALRFMPPKSAACWSDVLDATHVGDFCAQWNPGAGGLVGSEDCLTVNVWTPTLPSASEKLPVLLWNYGGGDLIGSATVEVTDGQALANAEHAIVVSYGYRVGALGFLAHPTLTAATPQHTSGNYGLLDAVMAMRWVQDNIEAFGGDKSRVMIFGESAGAINTCALLASPLTKGLFSSALMQSGNCAGKPLAERYAAGNTVVAGAACASAPDVVACLQNAPLSSILQNTGVSFVGYLLSQVVSVGADMALADSLPFGPTVDGYFLEDTPIKTIQAGKHNHVPLVIGNTDEEFASFIPGNLIPPDERACTTYEELVKSMFPNFTATVLAAYPCDRQDPTSGYAQLTKLLTDAFFACPSRRALRAAAATQAEPVYRYLFTVGVAGHGGDVPYVWDSFATLGLTPTNEERTLGSQMRSYWANFASSGNPNGDGLPAWSAYDAKLDNAVKLDTPIDATSAIDTTGCNFWDSGQ